LSAKQFLIEGIAEDEATAEQFAAAVRGLEESGFPLLDAVDYLPLDDPTDHIGLTKRKLSALSPGITHFLMHPAVDYRIAGHGPDWPTASPTTKRSSAAKSATSCASRVSRSSAIAPCAT
jgi:hypothetical protein